ncbi:MAG TPA: HAMP domain-containing sensor histidine kinase [Candidatus Saccharimonadales bacterium]|nr:HAMP domain-containing sensor histidine kinase [Candidatus Saccharimonadales bacterium]
MFRSATVRLTLWYLAIVMAISLIFSGILYNETTRELNRGLRSESQRIVSQYPVFQGDPDLNLGPNTYYQDSSHRILIRLVGLNLIVLVVAGFSSYWLARRTLEPIEAAHARQKRFTSDVSHELRTPLTAIKMESEVALMNSKASASELRGTIESNLEEVAKLESLINNLLRLSRLEADELQQNFVSVDSKSIFDDAVAKLGKKANTHNINVKVGKHLNVQGDKDSLVQLLVILLDNAIKYSPQGSEIQLSARSTKEDIIWEVSDHGVGIDPVSLEHVFDRFYRADNSRNKANETEGYGLGLSIAQMIADIHDGTITITSQVQKGTSVSVHLKKIVTT